MNSFSINFLIVLFVASLATLGWFGFQQLERGDTYVVLEQGSELPEVPEPEPEPEPAATTEPTPEPEPEPEPEPVSEEYADLIARLEGLIEDVVIMRDGSRGTRVGTVQEFLNIYFDRSDTVDNAFGPGTEARVRDFQRAEGLTADGQAGPNTYRAMIEALEER
jgi:peptidoglycan hydrolase-like protein with peptidoglycan-binding domain